MYLLNRLKYFFIYCDFDNQKLKLDEDLLEKKMF